MNWCALRHRARAVGVVVAIVAVAMLFQAERVSAAFHLEVIDQVMTSYGDDATVQFIEVRLLAGGMTFVSHSVLAAFDTSGAYIGDILVVPNNLTNGASGARWLVGTTAFQTASGVTPDFIMPAGVLPSGGGMVCFGGGGGVVPMNPPDWDRTAFSTYVDCVAYGTYTGPSNARTGTPTQLNGDGHSLQRTGNTQDNAADFACGDPATPENNAGDMGSLPATSPCSGGEPTATVPPAGGCVGDCDGSGNVAINELILGVSISLGTAPLSECPSFDCQQTGQVAISCLITAVNNSLNGCPS
jgi:hypothetical protein